jgi:hypothetical protein
MPDSRLCLGFLHRNFCSVGSFVSILVDIGDNAREFVNSIFGLRSRELILTLRAQAGDDDQPTRSAAGCLKRVKDAIL